MSGAFVLGPEGDTVTTRGTGEYLLLTLRLVRDQAPTPPTLVGTSINRDVLVACRRGLTELANLLLADPLTLSTIINRPAWESLAPQNETPAPRVFGFPWGLL